MSENPTPPVPHGIDRTLEILAKGTVETEHGLMRWSSNYTFLVSVSLEDQSLPAIYKPQRGERPLWDFPDGMLCNRELAAFLTSEQLGWRIVPPTVVRDGPRGLGSLQCFIDHDPELNYFTFDESTFPQTRRICAFDYMVNNADRKGGHCLLDSEGHVWGIDHGITFHSSPKLRTVIWEFADQRIPAAMMDDMHRLCALLEDPRSEYHQTLGGLLTGREIAAFHNRIRHLLKAGTFPSPGPGGPNYPWPPV